MIQPVMPLYEFFLIIIEDLRIQHCGLCTGYGRNCATYNSYQTYSRRKIINKRAKTRRFYKRQNGQNEQRCQTMVLNWNGCCIIWNCMCRRNYPHYVPSSVQRLSGYLGIETNNIKLIIYIKTFRIILLIWLVKSLLPKGKDSLTR